MLSGAELYVDGRDRFLELVRGLTAEELGRTVPGSPKWTVKDVVGHLAGVAEDVVARRMAGAPWPEWTAPQVERARARSLDEVVAGWDESLPGVLGYLEKRPQATALVLDVGVHEQDVRGAVGRPGARDNGIIAGLFPPLLGAIEPPAPLLIRTEDGDTRVGPEGDPVLLNTSRFEAFRWRFGRRSRAQLAAMDWSGDPAPYLDHLGVFEPSEADIIE